MVMSNHGGCPLNQARLDFGKQVGEQREPHSEIPPAVQWREHVELSMGIWAKGCVLFFEKVHMAVSDRWALLERLMLLLEGIGV